MNSKSVSRTGINNARFDRFSHAKSLVAAVALALGAGLSGASAAELFTNGDMATFVAQGAQGSAPTGWAINASGTQSATNSPFTNAYANNSSSFQLDDIGDGTSGASQAFSTTMNYQTLTVNFDFMVPTLTPGLTAGAWGIQWDGAGVSGTPGSSSVHYRIDRNGNFSINAGPGGGSIIDIVSLDAGAWYNVQATFVVTAINDGSNNGAGSQSGSITKFGGATTSWNNVATLNTTLGYSRLLVRDRTTTDTSSLLIDNVSAIPEPGSALLVAGGLVALAAFRRRRA